MKQQNQLVLYLLINALIFYIAPFLMFDTGSAMSVLLLGVPVACFTASVFFGINNAFNWLYPLGVAAAFASTVFTFYNSSATIYIFIYGIIALIGNFIGSRFYKHPNR